MRLLALLALALVTAAPVAAQQPALAPGGTLPLATRAFTTAQGGQVTLRQATGQTGLVVVFWSNACPWTERYAARVAELARDYTAPGIGFVAVGSNDPVRFPDESAERVRARLGQFGFDFPYVMDEGGALARAFGVRNTPQVFFFSADGTLLYDGAIDDSPAAEARVTRPYLRQAMDQHLAGLPVEVRQTQAFGCTVRLP